MRRAAKAKPTAPGKTLKDMPPVNAWIFPMYDPVAFAVGPIAVRWYGLAYLAGFLAGWYYARCLAANARLWGETKRPNAADIDDMLVYVVIGVILGGRLGHVLFYEPGRYILAPLEIVKIWQGGMSFHGGLVGAILAIVLFARRRGLAPLALLDIAAVVVPIGIGLGRLANFINGELWGKVAPDTRFAVIFPHAGPEPRHPSQLYEAFAEGLVLLIVLAILARRWGFHRPGRLAGAFGMGYAAARIICEFFREPDFQIGYLFGGWFTMGMLLSLPMAAIGLWLVLSARTSNQEARPA